MIKVLLVEDKANDASLILKLVDWDELGLQLVGIAPDGIVAAQMEEMHRPDIIITDIVMPLQNGIDFTESIRKKREKVSILFVTGHTDFKYAQSGIRLGIDQYLLKPVNQHQLHTALSTSVSRIVAEKKKQFEQEQFQRQLDENLSKLQVLFLNRIINFSYHKTDLDSQLSFYHITLCEENLCMLCIRPEAVVSLITKNEYENQLMQFELRNAIEEQLHDIPGALCFEVIAEKNQAVLLNCPNETAYTFLSELAQSIIQNVHIMCGFKVNIGVGMIVQGFKQLPASYKSAYAAADHGAFLQAGLIVFHDDIVNRQAVTLEIGETRDDIVRAVVNGDMGMLSLMLKKLSHEILNIRPAEQMVKNLCAEIISCALTGVDRSFLGALESSAEYATHLYGNLYLSNTLDEILSVVDKKLRDLCENVRKKTQDRHASITASICEIINSRMNKNLSVEQIAHEVFLSRAYATQIFKNETGESISRYMIRARMTRAKALLHNRSLRIIDVANQVGYENATHFSSLFKNETGISPKEYREQECLCMEPREIHGANNDKLTQ